MADQPTDQAITRIAMWSGPRNISTAMMRSFENRPDTVVIDEPFYAYYLAATGIDHPGRGAIIASQPTEADAVTEQLFAPLPPGKTVFYQKLMTHHMMPDFDLSTLDGLTHVFLIRDPREMLASYREKRSEITISDIGVVQMEDLYNRTADRLGAAPPVLDSRDVLRQPERALRALCRAVDIPFDPSMLSWPKGRRDTDGIWAPHWYQSVESSTGFMPYQDKQVVLTRDQEKIADQCQPIFDRMKAAAIPL